MKMAHLLFKIDSTGSMGQWISALNQSLPSIIKSMAMTNIFEKIGIIVYHDYDMPEKKLCRFSGFCDSTNPTQVNSLQKFSSGLKPEGGAGAPECVKTCLFKISEIIKTVKGKTYIIHLTDAPPHEVKRLDNEGTKEQKKLGDKFDWIKLVDSFLTSNQNVRYMCLTTCVHSFYCYLAQRTGGDVYKLNGYINKENITNELTEVFNGFTGIDIQSSTGRRWFIKNTQFTDEKILSNEVCYLSPGVTTPCAELMGSLTNSVNRMRKDEVFVEHIISEFELLIKTDLMAFTISPVLGKMWREFCKRRSDARRDELIELFQKGKNRLPDKQKAIMEEWLKESYNSTAEINEDIKTFVENNDVMGLLRFVPENEELCAQKVVQLLASGCRKSTTLIRAILSRMYVDKNYKLEKKVYEDDVPLPERSIPLNLSLHRFFELIMHTVAPGTKLTRRYSAMLACHAIQCGCVLKESAEKYLASIKGKWINWKRRNDGTPEVPESWSRQFLDLILHKDCQTYLTETELQDAKRFRKISSLLTFYYNVEVTVKMIEPTSVDTKYPDHMIKCKDCKYERPLSLIDTDGICGYCKDDTSSMVEKINYVQVRCYSCGSIYSRNSDVTVPGYSKCHGCRWTSTPSPACECNGCRLKFVKWFETSKGLPDGKCGGCATNMKPRLLKYKEFPTLIHQLFGNYFKDLCQALGFKVASTFQPNCALYDAVLHITEEPGLSLVSVPTNVLFRDNPIQNVEELWNYTLEVMKGKSVILPECSVCLELLPPSELVRACGRKGCEQRVCNNCSQSWYGKNTVGCLIYQRATMCQFCSRLPNPQLLGRVNRNLIDLVYSIAQNELDPDKYYAWCIKCFKQSEIGERACAVVAPNIQNHVCKTCKPIKEIKVLTKECPKCTVATDKSGGCNHIHCSSCNTHWCWECGQDCKTSSATYDHMRSEHGRIYEDEAPHHEYYDGDEYDDDY